MNDVRDSYIRQSLKNWAARHQLPANGRSRLIWSVATGRTEPHRKQRSARSNVRDGFLYRTNPNPYWDYEPFSYTRLWMLHMTLTTLLHLA